MKNNDNGKKLADELKIIESSGITADKRKLTRDMCAQFSDPDEYIREYVVNSFDARATKCEIYGEEDEQNIFIYIRDNGHGMNKKTLNGFFTLYRSEKQNVPGKAIGRFGIGKVSVAAVPEQSEFFVRTSDGIDCFEAKTGSFLNNDPIFIYEVSPVPERGTTFKITFRKKESLSIVLKKLANILKRFVKYLPMEIIVYHVAKNKTGMAGTPETINQPWQVDDKPFGHRYYTTIWGKEFEILLSLGKEVHEIYQNRVFISDKYNLLKPDKEKEFELPFLNICVESSQFELPFGRHCLSDEDILVPLADYIREELFPGFWDELVEKVWVNDVSFKGFSCEHLEKMAIRLMYQWTDLRKSWCQIPIFNIYPVKRVSLAGLEKMVVKSGKIYIASSDNTGMNYAGFDGPVLLQEQPANCFNLILRIFERSIIDLNMNDTVMEAPPNVCPNLTMDEIYMEDNLGFHKDLFQGLGKKFFTDESTESALFTRVRSLNEMHGIYPELRKAENDFEKVKWKINYLVNRDLTPCKSHRFIIVNNSVVLNLYHPDVRRLVKICRMDPKLAGHWAVAMCLTEDNRILPHLTSESREDLLMLDAMAKVISEEEISGTIKVEELRKMKKSFLDLLKNINRNLN